MDITKFSYSAAQLEGMGPDNLSLALLLGLFLNEANWLQKLLLISTLDESGGEPERRARMSLSLMLTKILAAKMLEGWKNLTTGKAGRTLDSLALPAEAHELRKELTPMLAKKTIIYEVRNLHGGHYPASLSLEKLKGISEADLVLFMTPYAGDTLSTISGLAAASSMTSIAPARELHESMDKILGEIVKALGLYCQFMHAALAELLAEKIQGQPATEAIPNDDAPAYGSIRLPFFAVAPPHTS